MTAGSVHEGWNSQTSFILAAIGAAVGLGNLWQFPFLLGKYGGGAFLLIYLIAVLLIVLPVLVAEFLIGRRGRMSAPESMRLVAIESGASPGWKKLGWGGLILQFFVLTFFCVIGGWTLHYVVNTGIGAFAGHTIEDIGDHFKDFQNRPVEMIVWQGLFLIITASIVARGLRGGIERAANILMPLLFLMLVCFVIYGFFSSGFSPAVSWLFQANFSEITPELILAATGQAFFSVGAGTGLMLTFAAYLPKRIKLTEAALVIAAGDTLVALLAGLAIFPIVFTYGLESNAGPGLLFVTLSTAFTQMPFGQFIGTAFFFFVFIAAITTSIAALEAMVARAEEYARFTRPVLSAMIAGLIGLAGLSTVFSFNVLSDFYPLSFIPRFAESTFFSLNIFLVNNLAMPLCGIGFVFFAGWRMKQALIREEFDGKDTLYQAWRLLSRYLAPLAILIIFVFNLMD